MDTPDRPTTPDRLVAELLASLQASRDAVVGALDGLSEHDVRRPLTASGTNLLGLVKHLAGGELSYLGDCVGRPAPVTLPWVEDGSIWDNADMWATADQTRAELVDLYRTAWAHSDASVAELSPDDPATVAWWPEARRRTTMGALLVRVVAETARHAGHADLLRESLDGRTGADDDLLGDPEYRTAYVARIRAAADAHLPRAAPGAEGDA